MSRLTVTTCLLTLFVFVLPAQAKKGVDLHIYPTYASKKGVWVSGRVLKKSRFINEKKPRSRFRVFMKAFRRFTRSALKKKKVLLSFQGMKKTVVTDKYGYFFTRFPFPPTKSRKPSSKPVKKKALPPFVRKPKHGDAGAWFVRGKTLFQKEDKWENTSSVGVVARTRGAEGLSVISDIDDTLIQSNIKNKLKMIRTFFFRGHREVKVFPDALSFLRLVLASPQGRGGGALHYISGSPVNLYDRLLSLFVARQFPQGSMSLKYLSGRKKVSLSKQKAYKINAIRPILRRFPKRRFLLVGDTTEQDTEVYLQIKKEFPAQVAGIFIHNVSGESQTNQRFKGVFLFTKYLQAITYAKKKGWIQ